MCDKKFHLDSLLEMYKEEHNFGVVFITGKMYELFKVTKTGNGFEKRKVAGSTIRLPKKQKKGGQSAQRFCRIRENEEAAYIKKVGEITVETFYDKKQSVVEIQKLFIIGPSSKKTLLFGDSLIKQYFPNIEVKNSYEEIVFEPESEDDKLIEYIKTMLETSVEQMYFGTEEINENFENVRLIICDEKSKANLNKTGKASIKVVPEYKLKIIGLTCVGFKWF